MILDDGCVCVREEKRLGERKLPQQRHSLSHAGRKADGKGYGQIFISWRHTHSTILGSTAPV